MHDTSKEAGRLVPGDLIDAEHHGHDGHDGPPCTGTWCVKAAVVDRPVDKILVTSGRIDAVVRWHDPDHPTVCGVMVVDTRTRIRYHGHLRAAA